MLYEEQSDSQAQQIADEITNWAQLREISDDPYISAVAEAIRTQTDLNFWAQQDALQLLPSSAIAAGSKLMRLSRILAALRNVLVFVPVAITWKAVADATNAFAEFIEDNGAATVNFLEFWQNGYGYLDPFWTIGNIANIDAAIIVGVIVVSLFSNSLYSRGLEINQRSGELFENERISIGIGLNRYLSGKKQATAETLNQSVITAIEKLNVSAKEMAKVSQSIAMASDQVENILPGIEKLKSSIEVLLQHSEQQLTQFMSTFESSLTSSSADLITTISELKVVMQEINKLADNDMKNSLNKTSTQLTNMVDELESNSNEVKSSTRVLQDELQTLQRKLSRLITDLDKTS
jgi:hypothetical protein